MEVLGVEPRSAQISRKDLLSVETITTPNAPDVGSHERRSHDLPLLHSLAQHPTSLARFNR